MKIQNKLMNKKTITSRELCQLLSVKGFTCVRSRGDHKIYKKDDKTVTVNTRNLNRMVALRLIKENDLLSEESDSKTENGDEDNSTVLKPEVEMLCFN